MNDMWSCQVVTYRKQKTKEYIKCLALNSIWLRKKNSDLVTYRRGWLQEVVTMRELTEC